MTVEAEIIVAREVRDRPAGDRAGGAGADVVQPVERIGHAKQIGGGADAIHQADAAQLRRVRVDGKVLARGFSTAA